MASEVSMLAVMTSPTWSVKYGNDHSPGSCTDPSSVMNSPAMILRLISGLPSLFSYPLRPMGAVKLIGRSGRRSGPGGGLLVLADGQRDEDGQDEPDPEHGVRDGGLERPHVRHRRGPRGAERLAHRPRHGGHRIPLRDHLQRPRQDGRANE